MTSSPADGVRSFERLQEIAELDLLTDEFDEELQDLVRHAARELDLPIALISIVLDDSQYFVAMEGTEGWLAEVRGTPIEWSFCANVVRTESPFLVDDAPENDLVRDNPLVRHDGLRSYAGVPLRTSKGHVLGSFCVLGDRPRDFDETDVSVLHGLAKLAVERIERRRRSEQPPS